MNAEQSKELLYTSIELISDKNIRRFTRNALDKTPEGFWKAPASSTGNNHPPENNNLIYDTSEENKDKNMLYNTCIPF